MVRREFGELTGGELTRFDCMELHSFLVKFMPLN